ncbi:hypothetical protein C2G38_2218753 [Gigaspora rosea]|uniref:Uncharacterized protein n=1 Tax=Gigaspora rosea TaxID=44941 RepID=A0A397U6D4_9GLOM|nr:hypothetical protein C2G38_2218753 [Gigaspora rosea]
MGTTHKKDQPLRITSEIINQLYDSLIGFHFNQYQEPLRTRWGYELIAAKQFLESRKMHIKTRSCSTNFSRNKLEKLLYGRQAYEMPDKANEWLNFLIEMKTNFYIFFADDLHEALNILSEQEFEVLVEQLECGLEKAIESYKKWLTPWYHLPLSICRLEKSPAEQEIAYSNQIQEDYDQNLKDFGLREMLIQNPKFRHEFESFSVSKDSKLYMFPQVYEFVRTQIYFIVTHLQQVEGLFNKFDIKTHLNQCLK